MWESGKWLYYDSETCVGALELKCSSLVMLHETIRVFSARHQHVGQWTAFFSCELSCYAWRGVVCNSECFCTLEFYLTFEENMCMCILTYFILWNVFNIFHYQWQWLCCFASASLDRVMLVMMVCIVDRVGGSCVLWVYGITSSPVQLRRRS